MEEKKVTMSKTALTYGLGLSGILILLELLFYSLDIDRESKIRWVSIILVIGAMVLGVKSYRDTDLKGFITYGNSVSLSFLIGLYSAVVVSIFMFFMTKYIDPGMIEMIIEQGEEKILNGNPDISDQEYEMAMTMVTKMATPLMITIWTLVGVAFQSIIVALIISIFMKKKDDSLDAIIS